MLYSNFLTFNLLKISELYFCHVLNLILINKEKDGRIKVHGNNRISTIVSKNTFFDNWTGLIIAIEKNANPKRKRSLKKLAIIFIFILLIIQFYSIHYSIIMTVYLIVSIIGLYLTYLISKEKFKLDSFSSKLCSFSKRTDCETVLNSKEAKLFNIFDLTDMSVIYFSFITIAFIHNPNNLIFFVLSVLSILIIVYSVFYQYFKIKKWCPLCLSIASVLTIQFFLMLFNFKELHFKFSSVLLFGIFLGILIISWQTLKMFIVTKQKHNDLAIENLTFRRNHHLFFPYYQSLKRIDANLDSVYKISLGKNASTIKLIAITNPLCKSCRESHKVYNHLLQKYPNDIEITFLFLVPYKNKEDFRTQISERLLEIYVEEDIKIFNKAFDEWFEYVNVEIWLKKWGKCKNLSYNLYLAEQVNWCLKSKITSTPILIINSKLFPETYHPKDIENFIEPILEFENNKIGNNIRA